MTCIQYEWNKFLFQVKSKTRRRDKVCQLWCHQNSRGWKNTVIAKQALTVWLVLGAAAWSHSKFCPSCWHQFMTGRMDEARRRGRETKKKGRVQTSDMEGVLPMHYYCSLKILKLFLFYSFIEVISAVNKRALLYLPFWNSKTIFNQAQSAKNKIILIFLYPKVMRSFWMEFPTICIKVILTICRN